MENRTNLEILSEKISKIMQMYQNTQDECDALRTEIVRLKAECEIKTGEIAKLNDDILQKDLEIEEIVRQIETIVG